MIAPCIKYWVIPNAGIVAIVGATAVEVAAIDAGPIDAVAVVCTRVIGMAATGYIGALHVSAVPAGVYDARSVVHTHNRAPAMHATVNLHAVAVDRANRSVATDVRRSPAAQRNVSASGGRMGAGATSVASVCAASIPRSRVTTIASRCTPPAAARSVASVSGRCSTPVGVCCATPV